MLDIVRLLVDYGVCTTAAVGNPNVSDRALDILLHPLVM